MFSTHFLPHIPICKGLYISAQTLLVDGRVSASGHRFNVRGIVVCSTTSRPTSSIRSFTVYVHDDPKEDIKCFFDPVIAFIQDQLQQGDVLICNSGGSRSAAIAMAFLMKTYQMDVHMAYRRVCTHCGMMGPNPGFMSQLLEYADSLGVITREDQRWSPSPTPSESEDTEDVLEAIFCCE